MTPRRNDPKTARRANIEIGWRECIGLPELGIRELPAKIDTGARTSALHAEDMRVFSRKGVSWVRFRVPRAGMAEGDHCAARLIDERRIKNTSGLGETRLVVRTLLVLGSRNWHIDVSLADRENMGFDLILGRTAIRGHGLVVNPGRSWLMGPPDSKNGAA